MLARGHRVFINVFLYINSQPKDGFHQVRATCTRAAMAITTYSPYAVYLEEECK